MRLDDWKDRLESVIAQMASKPFEWGENDCILFSSACVEAITGNDLASDFHGRYSTKEGAKMLMNEIGCDSISALCQKYLGTENKCDVKEASVGDVVIFESSEEGEVCGICLGRLSLFVNKTRISRIKTVYCKAAWRVA